MLADDNRRLLDLAGAHDPHGNGCSHSVTAQERKQVIVVPHRVAVQSDDRIAHNQSPVLGRAARLDAYQEQSSLLPGFLCQRFRQTSRLEANAQVSPADPSVGD
jgi:hypothetical protein